MNFTNSFIKQNIKSPKDKAKEENNEKLFFHKDFYCQVELLPRENLSELEKENKKIQDFSQKTLRGFGGTDIYARNRQKFKTSDKKIELSDIENELMKNIWINNYWYSILSDKKNK
ncbi:MAG: hypothetical protein GC181_10090 [Bacteroidetes bacterium]|nr:hypothetical protein [Bacteroidota bacterium]